MKILLINSDQTAFELEEALSEVGTLSVFQTASLNGVDSKVEAEAYDLLVLNVTSIGKSLLGELRALLQVCALPIVVFSQRESEVRVEEVVQAGVSAYILDGLKKQRVKPIVAVALARFNQFRFLQDEMLSAKQALADRKHIERAKGILMKQKRLDESDAYKLLRKAAMDQNKKLAEVAQNVISLEQIMG